MKKHTGFTMGFTEKYYTLWHVGEPYRHYVDRFRWVMRRDAQYIQNLSTDMEKAEAKMVANYGKGYSVDLDLRGHSGWVRGYEVGEKGTDLQLWQVQNGWSIGEDLRTTDAVGTLFGIYYDNDENPRTRVYARRRLVELGKLTRYPKGYKGRIYLTAKEIEWAQEAQEAATFVDGHWFAHGGRVELELVLKAQFGFDTQYGWCTIQKFVDSEKRVFIYMGSSPKQLQDGDTVTITAGIKHCDYKGTPQTKLLRIKVLAFVSATQEPMAESVQAEATGQTAEAREFFAAIDPIWADLEQNILRMFGTFEKFAKAFDWKGYGLGPGVEYADFDAEDWQNINDFLHEVAMKPAQAKADADFERYIYTG